MCKNIYLVTVSKFRRSLSLFLCSLSLGLYAADDLSQTKAEKIAVLDTYNVGQMLDGALHVSALEAATLLKQNPKVKVLDVRTPEEYSQGHIDGATLLDYKAKDFAKLLETLDKGSTWIMHCRSGRRSTAAMALMKNVGFKSIVHMDGGFNSWVSEGLDVTSLQ